MTTPQPDKTGMHILLKLASLVVILAGIHAAANKPGDQRIEDNGEEQRQ